MKRLAPAFMDCTVTYATVGVRKADPELPGRYVTIPDANRDTKFRLVLLVLRLAWLVILTRPNLVISTGAAPGYIAIRLGKLLGAKTIFLDSIANADELSMSARLALPHADVTLSQWPCVADREGTYYWGAVL
jgi:hypothetical protein